MSQRRRRLPDFGPGAELSRSPCVLSLGVQVAEYPMATTNPKPLQSQAEFEHVVTEVERLLEEPHVETIEDRYFAFLLGQIADYHDTLPPARRDANAERIADLDRQLKAYGKRWPKRPDEEGDHHWSPMLGVDVDPDHHRG